MTHLFHCCNLLQHKQLLRKRLLVLIAQFAACSSQDLFAAATDQWGFFCLEILE